jgi:CHAD domain-containing protein
MRALQEKERKYDVGKRFRLPDFADALAGEVRVVRRAPADLDAVYFDTDDLRLLQAGVTLRRRSGGSDAGWHLKLPSPARETRTEVQLPLDAGSPTEVPGELVDLVSARTRGRQLRPIARLRTSRGVTSLVGADGAGSVEVAEDEVDAEVLRNGKHTAWREIEAEVGANGGGLAKRVDKLLRQAGARVSPESSKLATALAKPRIRAPGPAVSSKSPREVLRRFLAEQTEALLAQDVEVRRGELDDAVHDMRVAARRLRSCLRTFAPMFESAQAAKLERELQWLSGLLGAVRDAQVLRAHMALSVGSLAPTGSVASVGEDLDHVIGERLRLARNELGAGLRSERYRELLNELVDFAARPAYRGGARPHRRRLRRLVEKEIRRTRRRVVMGRRSSGEGRDHALHQARKSAKRTRYAAETVSPLWPKCARRLARRFERLQQLLGDRHDAVIARSLLREHELHAVSPSPEGTAAAFSYGILIGQEEARIAVVDDALARMREHVRHSNSLKG